MENHIVVSYDRELDKLRTLVLNMGSLVHDLLIIANHAIDDPQKSFVELADSTDKKINHFDAQIELSSVQILALRQPLAIDLRLVISALKLAVILERMGDLAKKISHRVQHVTSKLKPELKDLIKPSIDNLERLLKDVFKAYENLDLDLAKKVAQQDYISDDYHRQIMDLLELEIKNDPSNTKSLINVVLIARNLERIGDYITKISYLVHYIITGEQLTSVKL
jgi:phosphate transport system protein